MTRSRVYEWREDDPAFAVAWDAALDEAADTMEREAWRRAVEGVEKPVFGALGGNTGSGEIGRIQEYSDTLLIFLLKGARPEKYRERHDVTGKIATTQVPFGWDATVTEIEAGSTDYLETPIEDQSVIDGETVG